MKKVCSLQNLLGRNRVLRWRPERLKIEIMPFLYYKVNLHLNYEHH
jgi:hypothetical protein